MQAASQVCLEGDNVCEQNNENEDMAPRDMVYCRYEGEHRRRHLAESRVNMAGGLNRPCGGSGKGEPEAKRPGDREPRRASCQEAK